MTTAEIRTDLLKKIETLDKKRLEELYGYVLNFLNNKKETGTTKLSPYEKAMLEQGISELNEGKGIAHEEVMNKYRKKYRS